MFQDKDIGVVPFRFNSEDGTIVPVEKEDLPVTLPKDVDLNSSGNPLDSHPSWKTLYINRQERKPLEKLIL